MYLSKKGGNSMDAGNSGSIPGRSTLIAPWMECLRKYSSVCIVFQKTNNLEEDI